MLSVFESCMFIVSWIVEKCKMFEISEIWELMFWDNDISKLWLVSDFSEMFEVLNMLVFGILEMPPNHGFENFYVLNENNQAHENNENLKIEISKNRVSKTTLKWQKQ